MAKFPEFDFLQRMRNKKELNNFRKALHIWNAQLLYISEEISAKAMFYVEQHSGNDKHYKVLKDLEVTSQ